MSQASLLKASFDYLRDRLPLYGRTEAKLRALGPPYADFAEKLLAAVWKVGDGHDGYHQALDAFIQVSREYISLQIETMKTGRYRYSKYAEVQRDVYDNPAVMDGYYLNGLLLSQVFWINHYRICGFLLDFVSQLPPCARGLDLPCGSGVQSALLLSKRRSRSHLLGDIAPRAIACARKFIEAYVGEAPSGAMVLDARRRLPLADRSLDYLCCCELIEHLENPAALMTEFRRVLKDDGQLFLSTVAFTAALDHIYMFESLDEIEALLRNSGFRFARKLVLAVSGREEEVPRKRKPLNAAFVLEKGR